MKLWRDNKIANEYGLPEEEIAKRFLASKYSDLDQYPWPLDRALSTFIGDNEPDGLASAFYMTDPAYERVAELITKARVGDSP